MTTSHYQLLPSVDKLLQNPKLGESLEAYGHADVTEELRAQLGALREQIARGDSRLLAKLEAQGFADELCVTVANRLATTRGSTLLSVFNLTGTVIHTNLGRCALPQQAIEAMSKAAAAPSNLEFDLESNRRGDRDDHLVNSLCALTGAEAATVVNNNAAAVLLVLNTLAQGKQVPISRGELVEIGGAFRIPEVMKSAGCELLEIGTTNRTHLKDYRAAISPRTAALMKVHTSNYEIQGFTKTVSHRELADLAQASQLPLVSDLGSGTLIDLQKYGLPKEPTVAEVLAEGADLVTFSGDKLLGGPQAGIIVGRKDLIQRIKDNPLKRALRVDKLTLAALVAVIDLYRDPHRLGERLPLLADLSRSVDEIDAFARVIFGPLSTALEGIAAVDIVDCKSQIGSGALPLDLIPSKAIRMRPLAGANGREESLQELSLRFRRLPKPVIGRVKDGDLYFDLRCLVKPEEFLSQLEEL